MAVKTSHVAMWQEREGGTKIPQETPEVTDTYRETVETALEHGYFQIPREGTLEDLAKEMGISEQTLSKRLRRGYDNLIQTKDEES